MARRGGAALLVVALLAAACDSADVEVRPERRLQVMQGWEGLIGGVPECDLQAWRRITPRVVELAADELGMNRVRLPLRSGLESRVDHFSAYMDGRTTFDEWKVTWFRPHNDDDDPGRADPAGFQWSYLDAAVEDIVLPMRRRLQARGDDLWINLIYVGARTAPVHADPEEYAEFVVAAFTHLRDRYDLVPQSFEILNEPNMHEAWSPAQMARALITVKRRLAEHGFTPRLLAPSTSTINAAVEYLDSMRLVPGVDEALTDVSYHRYGGGEYALRRLTQRAGALNLRTAMLEKINADEHVLHEDLTMGQVSAWGQFGMVSCPPRDRVNLGGIYVRVDATDPQRPTARLTPYARMLRQYFRYIHLGARRVAASVRDEELEATAFVNPDGRHVVVANVRRARTVTIRGLPPGRYASSFTTAHEDHVVGSDTTIVGGGIVVARIPGAGVLTVFAR